MCVCVYTRSTTTDPLIIQSMQSNLTMRGIALGDSIEQISKCLYYELDILLNNMKNQDPEFRTQQLRSYLLKARKVIAQLQSITKWLQSNEVKKFFVQSYELEVQLKTIKESIVLGQDSLYFIHRDMFPKRSRPLEVKVAKDVLCSGTYSFLPESVIHVGMSELPTLMEKESVINDLNIFIQAKMILDDKIPIIQHLSFQVFDGKLIITYAKLYQLYLTLSSLTEKADWIVLGTKILVKSHISENYNVAYDQFLTEKSLVDVLRYYSSLSTNESKSIMTLDKLHILSYHYAISVAIRLMYIQALDLSRTVWKNHLEIEFQDIPIQNTIFFTRFWKGQISG